jgi:hypothetical protein
MKRYELKDIEAQIIEAHENMLLFDSMRADAVKRMHEAEPERPAHISRFDKRNSTPEWEAYIAKREEWNANECARVEQADSAYQAARLYYKAVCEMLSMKIDAIIDEYVHAPEFLNRFDGVPIRYKKVQNAIKALFDDRYFVSWNTHHHHFYVSFTPDEENTPYWDIKAEDVWFIGLGSTLEDVCFTKEWAETYPARTRENFPTFEEVHQACLNAPSIKKQHQAIMETARNEASKLVNANTCGLYAIREACDSGYKVTNY